jgi:hypothetical protein
MKIFKDLKYLFKLKAIFIGKLLWNYLRNKRKFSKSFKVYQEKIFKLKI